MKKLPIGRQNFEAIIHEDLLLVDKTKQVFELVDQGRLYFLSRPRRFGKSLLVSTLKYLFQGRKELFKDLYVGKRVEYDWQTYPVLQFNFAKFGVKVADFEQDLKNELSNLAQTFQVDLPKDLSLSIQFYELVKRLAKQGQPVVILIDEYDKPIIDFLQHPQQALFNQEIIKRFFSPLKELEAAGFLRFLFITGVSKFSKVSLFSDLNNLIDLSRNTLSHDLLGITHQELVDNFAPYLQQVSKKLDVSKSELLGHLKTWYNGYSYDAETFLYNPFSLLNFFQNQHFGNYWFATGTPSFLVQTIRDKNVNPREFEKLKVSETFFDKYSLEDLDMTGLLYQTGYLTIKELQKRKFETNYYLNYPNLEVRQSMMHNLVEAFSYKSPSTVSNALLRMRDGLEEGKVEIFIKQLQLILTDISYQLHPKTSAKSKETQFALWEGYFHTIIYLIISYMKLDVQAEVSKHKGRLDLVAQTADFIYIMEFKLDGTAKNAIAQIKSRDYVSSYQNKEKEIFLVGINFSKKERNIDSWEIEKWKA